MRTLLALVHPARPFFDYFRWGIYRGKLRKQWVLSLSHRLCHFIVFEVTVGLDESPGITALLSHFVNRLLLLLLLLFFCFVLMGWKRNEGGRRWGVKKSLKHTFTLKERPFFFSLRVDVVCYLDTSVKGERRIENCFFLRLSGGSTFLSKKEKKNTIFGHRI